MVTKNLLALPLLAALCLAPALKASDGDHDSDDLANFVYVHSNNPTPGKNAVLGYRRNPASGELSELPGSPFLTGGTGYLNANERLGPDDTDQEIVATRDRRFIYSVNQGSNTIAGFQVESDGSLKPVPGSPFPSGGVQPASIGIDGIELFVVNRGDDNPGETGTHKPVYSGFAILPNGSLISIPWSQLTLTAGASPSVGLVAPGGRLLFDSHLFETPFNNAGFPPFIPAFSSVLHSYKADLIGQLVPAAQAVAPAPIPPFTLGLQVHPTRKILYAGFVVASTLGTYTYDDNGNMTLVSTTPGAPNSGLCWIVISPDQKTIYTADAISDQIDVYSIAADPLHPVLVQTVDLKGPKGPGNFPLTGANFDTTPFQEAVSPDGKFLYVVNHETSNLIGGNALGNAIHILSIATGGKLTETSSSPLIFPIGEVPVKGHALGVVVF